MAEAEEEALERELGATGEEHCSPPAPHGGAVGDEPEDEPPQHAGGWTSFDLERPGSDLGRSESEPSPLEKLLDLGAECSVEQLLDDEDFLKEFQSGHVRLREHLCGPAAACALVRCVSADPPEDWPAEARLRRPYVAGEALALGCEQLCDALVREDAPLDLLWGFLDADPEGQGAPGPALAGYFAGCAAALVARRPQQVADHLRRRGPDLLFDRLLAWLGHRSAAELLAALLCAEDPARAVFPAPGLVQRLVGCLEGDAARLPHLALVVDALVARATAGRSAAGAAAGRGRPGRRGDICDAEVFLDELAAPAAVGALVAHALGGRGGGGGATASQAAADILSSAVAHLHALRRWDAGSPGCMSPAGGDSAVLGDSPNLEEGGAPCTRARGCRLVGALCEHVPGLCGVVDAVAAGVPGEFTAGGVGPSEDAEVSRALREAIVLLLEAARSETAGPSGGGAATAEPEAPGEEGDDRGSPREDPAAAREAEILSGEAPPPWTPASGAPRALPEEQAARLRELARGCPPLREALAHRGWSPVPGAPGAAGPVSPGGPAGGLGELLSDLRSAAQLRRQAAWPRPPPAGGAAALQVALLLALLAKTSHAAFFEAARGARLLQRCLAALLACAWSSPLQGALWSVLAEFLGGEEGALPAVLDLAGDAALMQRVVASVADEPDVGCMGFVRLLCRGLQKLAGSTPEVAAALSKIDRWSDVVARDLEDMEKVCKEHLGGAPPDAVDRPASGHDYLEALRSWAEEDGNNAALSPEDVRDIVEEDVEVQEALEMFQIQRGQKLGDARRQRAATPRQLTSCP